MTTTTGMDKYHVKDWQDMLVIANDQQLLAMGKQIIFELKKRRTIAELCLVQQNVMQ